MTNYILDHKKGIISLAGPDRFEFLQGLISQDVHKLQNGAGVIFAALLSPQGKFRHGLFVFDDVAHERLLILCASGDALMNLGRELRRHQLREDVKLTIAEGVVCALIFPNGEELALKIDGALGGADPRHAGLGHIYLLPQDKAEAQLLAAGLSQASLEDYHHLRLSLGVTDPDLDMAQDKTLLLEANYDQLNGISWDKGCYMGQELTARTKYRALIKKRLLPFQLTGGNADNLVGLAVIDPQTGKPCGQVTSQAGDRLMVMTQLADIATKDGTGPIPNLEIKGANDQAIGLHPALPDWLLDLVKAK